jgi:putative ABC transport system ATP-binding protein
MTNSTMNNSLFELKGVSKKYEQKGKLVDALADVTISIPRSTMISIQGPTGGGKSTLLQLLGALDRPSTGSVTFFGKDELLNLESLDESKLNNFRAQNIGFIFQNYNLIPTLSALENVATALEPFNIPWDERLIKATTSLERVGLAGRINHLPPELSGGEQQRVAIARALVKNPEVILADEPTGNLDEGTRDEIIGILENLWHEHGLTVVIVTHDSLVANRAELHLRIDQGRVTVN